VKRTERRSDCPINYALQTFGDPWSLLILRDLMFTGRRTYSDFLNAEEGMATNILAARLAWLQDVDVIRKVGHGKGARYALTQKGLDLLPAMLDLVKWSAKYDANTAAPKAFVARINKQRAAVEGEIRNRLRAEFELSS
jgi:DNA-binding HxlR family transcriptional regulator